MLVDLSTEKVVTNVPIEEAFYGIAFSHDGSALFCSGASEEVIHSFHFKDGILSNPHDIRLRDVKAVGVPAGLALNASATRLCVANLNGQSASEVDLRQGKVVDIPLTPAGSGFETVTTPGKTIEGELNHLGVFPYDCCLDNRRHRLYVSLWGAAQIAVVDLKSHQVIARWPTEEHPNEMLLADSHRILFVANANRNTVTVFDTRTGKALETLTASLYPNWPSGSTPNSLALTPDGKTLFVANADNNNLAVFDVSQPGHSHSLGFIPVGWYPTSVRVTPDGRHLLVAMARESFPWPIPMARNLVEKAARKRCRNILPNFCAGH